MAKPEDSSGKGPREVSPTYGDLKGVRNLDMKRVHAGYKGTIFEGAIVDPASIFPRDHKVLKSCNRVNADRSIQQFPGMFSNGVAVTNMQKDAHMALSAALPKDVVGNDVGPSGVVADFSRLLSVQGAMQFPLASIPGDNRQVLRDKLLEGPHKDVPALLEYLRTDKLPDEMVNIIVACMEVMAGLGDPGSIPIKKRSSTGMPYMSNDPTSKKEAIRPWLEQPALLASLIAKSDLPNLFYDHGQMLCYFSAHRVQSNTSTWDDQYGWVAKRRVVQDIYNASVKALMLTPTVRALNMASAARWRQVTAGSTGMFPLRLVAHSCETFLYHTYPETFLHAGQHDLTRKVSNMKRLVIKDVGNMDQTWPMQMRNAFVDAIGNLFAPWVKILLELSLTAPCMLRADYPDIRGGYIRGNPLDAKTFLSRYMFPSGIPVTSLATKMAGGAIMYYIAFKAGLADPGAPGIRAFFSHKARVRPLCAGDNMAFACIDDEDAAAIEAACNHWWPQVLDDSHTFAGFVFARQGNSLTVYPNITSFAEKLLMNDRSINTNSSGKKSGWERNYPHLGIEAKLEYYAGAPAFKEAASCLLWALNRNSMYNSWADVIRSMHKRVKNNVNPTNYFETAFRIDPSKIEYAFPVNEVRGDLLDEEYMLITKQQYQPLWLTMMN